MREVLSATCGCSTIVYMKTTLTTEPIAIRANGGSLYMKVPVELVRAHGLKPGDFIKLHELTIIKVADLVGEKLELA